MKERNTKQKQIILDILENNRIHPTINEIYNMAKTKYPTIGQATVYRNVNHLVEEGKLIKIPNNTNNLDHYDINTSIHSHLICRKCGRIIDVFDNDYTKLFNNFETNKSIKIDKVMIILEGICSNCNK
mgnify:CR=1 FL=1